MINDAIIWRFITGDLKKYFLKQARIGKLIETESDVKCLLYTILYMKMIEVDCGGSLEKFLSFDYEITTEYLLDGNCAQRFIDIALLKKKGNQYFPHILIEIKKADFLSDNIVTNIIDDLEKTRDYLKENRDVKFVEIIYSKYNELFRDRILARFKRSVSDVFGGDNLHVDLIFMKK